MAVKIAIVILLLSSCTYAQVDKGTEYQRIYRLYIDSMVFSTRQAAMWGEIEGAHFNWTPKKGSRFVYWCNKDRYYVAQYKKYYRLWNQSTKK